MASVLSQLPLTSHSQLLVGNNTSDDAAVYQLDAEKALIQTVDFFTPVVDDPYTFGQIAAANALSDIYAMGGKPFLALNIVGFPNCLPPEVLTEILRGGADMVQQSGAIIAGGHTIQDDEPKYGLAVSGLIHPQKIIRNSQAQAGDCLFLTKALGVGIINTAVKAQMASRETEEAALEQMLLLNRQASEAMQTVQARACTDITGFGLVGHALEMALASEVTLEIESSRLPILPGTLELAQMGLVPAGAYHNRDYCREQVDWQRLSPEMISIVSDPQTSGGLLISLAEDQVPLFQQELAQRQIEAVFIGRARKKDTKSLIFR